MSQRLANLTDPILICDAVTTLALPPPSYALVPSWWSGVDGKSGCIPEVDIDIWADGARALTAVELFVAEVHSFSFADVTVTAIPAVKALLDLGTKTANCNSVIESATPGESGNADTIAFVADAGAAAAGALTSIGSAWTYTFKSGVTTVANFESAIAASAALDVKTPGTGANVLLTGVDEFVATALAGGDDSELHAVAHGLFTGDGRAQVTSTGTIPAGLAALTDYYIAKDDADNVGLAATLSDAMAGNLIQFTGAGTGVIKLVSKSDTQRVHWHSHGLLGPAGDGAVTLDAQLAEWQTREHRPRAIAYALKATFGAGAGKVSAAIYPVVDAR